MPGMPHGYLGFNRVEAESTKATQVFLKDDFEENNHNYFILEILF